MLTIYRSTLNACRQTISHYGLCFRLPCYKSHIHAHVDSPKTEDWIYDHWPTEYFFFHSRKRIVNKTVVTMTGGEAGLATTNTNTKDRGHWWCKRLMTTLEVKADKVDDTSQEFLRWFQKCPTDADPTANWRQNKLQLEKSSENLIILSSLSLAIQNFPRKYIFILTMHV